MHRLLFFQSSETFISYYRSIFKAAVISPSSSSLQYFLSFVVSFPFRMHVFRLCHYHQYFYSDSTASDTLSVVFVTNVSFYFIDTTRYRLTWPAEIEISSPKTVLFIKDGLNIMGWTLPSPSQPASWSINQAIATRV